MFSSRTNNLRFAKIIGVIIIIGIIVIYTITRSLNYARGPEIYIFSPTNGLIATTSTIVISGRVLRVNKISLNGKSILIDENGYWKETLIIFSGLNKITVTAEDQFGRNVSKELDLVGTI